MRLEISASGPKLTDATRAYVGRRLLFTLGRFAGRLGRVRVRIAHVNTSQGAASKACRIEVRLSGLPSVVVEQTGTDLHAVIDHATDRIGRTVARRFDRARILTCERAALGD